MHGFRPLPVFLLVAGYRAGASGAFRSDSRVANLCSGDRSSFHRASAMSKSNVKQILADRIAAVEERLQAACRRSARKRSEITLVAITKTISPNTAALLPDLGVFDLGENRPQELWIKTGVLPPAVRWHMVGHLQRNKVERTLPLVRMIHSVDSVRLLLALEQEAVKQARVIEVLLEVNASREASKHGFAPAELSGLA